MKNLLIFFILALNCFNALCQSIIQQPDYLKGIAKTDTNFYDVKTSGEAYFAQDSLLRDGNKYGYKEFLRYLQFTEPRIHNAAGQPGNIKNIMN